MPDQRHLESVNGRLGESEIDRHLARLLSIAPSPAFGAQVRQRIRDGRAPHRAHSWWWIALAVPAALILVVMAALRPWRIEEAEAPRDARIAVDTALPSDAPVPEVRTVAAPTSRAVERPAKPPRVAAIAAAKGAAAPAQPEVLVSRDQLRAIARLQQLMVNGQLTEGNLPPVGSAPDATTDIQPAPLTIVPLTLPAVERVTGPEGSRARSQRQ
jgi:hypothetical protein